MPQELSTFPTQTAFDSNPIQLPLLTCIYKWHSTAALAFIYFLNQPTNSWKVQQIIQFKHVKVLRVWARQLIDKRHCSCANITTNKLRFNCFKPDIWLAGFENRTFDWLDLKLLEPIVQFCHASDWFSLSG